MCVDGRHHLWRVQNSSFRWLYNGLVSRLQTDPQQNDYPDKLASCLDVSGDGSQFPTCVTFNAQGTYLAVGTNTGTCIIVDYDTLGVAKQLRGHTRPITSVW